jgi:lysophospholipase L1-like esterase
VWVAGDSTVCDQSSTDYSGWAQHLPQFFSAPVSIANYADSGESSGSFLGNGRLWGAITAGWTSGDWVFIQFGHNDKTVTASAFRSNLTTMVTQAKSAGVRPILVTPISRAETALASQHVNSTGANLPRIVREVGMAESVPVIGLTVTTSSWLDMVNWEDYFALGTDRTHTNPAGAEIVAGFVRDAISEQRLGLASYLR